MGTGRGLIGAAVNPSIGIFDLATRTAQGIKNTALLQEKPYQRLRPPRGFGPERLLMEYSEEKAVGSCIMSSLDDRPTISEWHLFHCLTSNTQTLLLVSDKHLYLVDVPSQLPHFKCELTRKSSF